MFLQGVRSKEGGSFRDGTCGPEMRLDEVAGVDWVILPFLPVPPLYRHVTCGRGTEPLADCSKPLSSVQHSGVANNPADRCSSAAPEQLVMLR